MHLFEVYHAGTCTHPVHFESVYFYVYNVEPSDDAFSSHPTLCLCRQSTTLVIACNHPLRMAVFDLPELTNMIMCYGVARGNGREALCIYQQRFPHRNHPHHTVFVPLHQCLRGMRSPRPRNVGGGWCNVRTTELEDEVLERNADKPSTGTCAVAHAMGTSQSWVCQVLWEQNLHAYHL
jgi:hypothetical protein